jgi:hypothetical protein
MAACLFCVMGASYVRLVFKVACQQHEPCLGLLALQAVYASAHGGHAACVFVGCTVDRSRCSAAPGYGAATMLALHACAVSIYSAGHSVHALQERHHQGSQAPPRDFDHLVDGHWSITMGWSGTGAASREHMTFDGAGRNTGCDRLFSEVLGQQVDQPVENSFICVEIGLRSQIHPPMSLRALAFNKPAAGAHNCRSKTVGYLKRVTTAIQPEA